MNIGNSYEKFSGAIRDLKRQRMAASFVLTDADRTWGAIGAAAAAFAGNTGAAMMTASHMSDTNEDADFLEFSLEGRSFKGWVWYCPFKEGDVVDVIASFEQGHYSFIALIRPSDKTIALFPHCSRGKTSHILNALKWWARVSAFFVLSVALMAIFSVGMEKFFDSILEFTLVLSVTIVFCAAGVAFLAWKWMPFVKRAEIVFRAMGWSSPSGIDLKKMAKENRRWDDRPEYGVFYFRYDPSVITAPNSTA